MCPRVQEVADLVPIAVGDELAGVARRPMAHRDRRVDTDHTLTIIRPRFVWRSTCSCAVAISDNGTTSSIANPSHPAANPAFSARAASAFASAGTSSLPTKNTRIFLRACNKTHHDDDLDALRRTALTSAVYGRRAVARRTVEPH
jgi:hypothetical protein